MSLNEIEDLKASYHMGFFYSFLLTTMNIEAARMFSREICQTFMKDMSILLNELVITEGNIVTLDENAEIQKNTKHVVTALFLLKCLKHFNGDSLAHNAREKVNFNVLCIILRKQKVVAPIICRYLLLERLVK